MAEVYVHWLLLVEPDVLTVTDFNKPQGSLLGIISAAYNLGAICALPFVPYVNDTFGRRWAIFFGSWIMVLGSFIQAFATGGILPSYSL